VYVLARACVCGLHVKSDFLKIYSQYNFRFDWFRHSTGEISLRDLNRITAGI
jgi:hypothetical protein